MKHTVIFSLLLLAISVTAYSQSTKATSARAQSIYTEIGGNGLLISVNYDRRFNKSQKGFGMHLGMGFWGDGDGGILTFPIGINHLSGKAPHYLELGIGYTYATVTQSIGFLDGGGSLFIPSVGYRYQPADRGFTARIVVSPLVNLQSDGGIDFFAGLSAGFKF